MNLYDFVKESIYAEKKIALCSLNKETLQQAKYKGSNLKKNFERIKIEM